MIVKESAYTKRSPRKEPDLYDAEQSISTGTDRIKIHLPEVTKHRCRREVQAIVRCSQVGTSLRGVRAFLLFQGFFPASRPIRVSFFLLVNGALKEGTEIDKV